MRRMITSTPLGLAVQETGIGRETLHIDASTFRVLVSTLGPSLGFWRAAEVAALRRQQFVRPILELGCGDGLVSSLVLNRIEIGVDPYGEALAKAAARGLYDRLEAQPIERVRLEPQSAGTVISNSVLEHVAAIGPVLETIRQVLKPGGCFIFTVPTESLHRWLMLPLARYAAWRNIRYEHLNLWPIEQWRQRLEAAGLEIENVLSYFRRSQVAAWDAIDVLQTFRLLRKHLIAPAWRSMPSRWLDVFSEEASKLNFASAAPGGGRLIVARRV